ncbi:MAG TPA: hypothetical protein V6C57_13080 [Coleofasciculaceae cyanobacterium]
MSDIQEELLAKLEELSEADFEAWLNAQPNAKELSMELINLMQTNKPDKSKK